MITTTRYRRKSSIVDVFQFTDAGASLADLQAFMAPLSPSYDGKATLVPVRDHASEKSYPSLGRQFKFMVVADGDYVVKAADGDLTVLNETALLAEYELAVDDFTSGGTSPIVATHPRALAEQD